jgi:hypothetical protein
VVDEVLADAGQVGQHLDAVVAQVVAGPRPDSIRSFGVISAPAVTITSPRA